MDGERLLAVARAEAICAGVAAADDHHALAGCENLRGRIERIARAAAILLRQKTILWTEFAGASNLIGWRFRSCFEEMTAYRESWAKVGSHAPHEEQYARERALFGMFTSGVSCVESACYALHSLASHPSVLGLSFGEKEQRACTPSILRERLAEETRAIKHVSALASVLESKQWALWIDFRNRMSHRANLPRIVRGAMGSDPPPAKAIQFAATSSTRALESDDSQFEEMFSWLPMSLRSVLIGGTHLATGT